MERKAAPSVKRTVGKTSTRKPTSSRRLSVSQPSQPSTCKSACKKIRRSADCDINLSDVNELSESDREDDAPRRSLIAVAVDVHRAEDDCSTNNIDDGPGRDTTLETAENFVLVKFVRKQRWSYYAGEIVDIDSSDDSELQTCFLKRTDMRKGVTISFC